MTKNLFSINSEYSEVTDLISLLRSKEFFNRIPDKKRGEIEICLVEALNNVVRHSYLEQSGFEIKVAFEEIETQLRIEIEETGKPRPNLNKPSLDFNPDDIENLPEGGMGLFIIDQLMDSTEYTSIAGINRFIMIKSIN